MHGIMNKMRPEITLLVHNIRSTHNVGAIFRTAEGFGVQNIVLSGYTPYPSLGDSDSRLPHIIEKLSVQIHKTALGAETMVPFTYTADLRKWIDNNRASNQPLPLYALEQSARSVPLPDFRPDNRFALLLGEEVHGIEAPLLDMCDTIIEIPMFGQKESFNVSVATGIALYGLRCFS